MKKKIKGGLKKKILKESEEAGCNIASLARRYNLRPGLLYRWRGRNKKGKKSEGAVARGGMEVTNERFMEVRVEGTGSQEGLEELRLQEGILNYGEVTIKVCGKESEKILSKLMKVMERAR